MTKAKRLTDEQAEFIGDLERLGRWEQNLEQREYGLARWHKGLQGRERVLEERKSFLQQRELRIKERELRLQQWSHDLKAWEERLIGEQARQAQRGAQIGQSVSDFNLGVFLFNIIMWGVFFGAAVFIGHHVVDFLHQVF